MKEAKFTYASLGKALEKQIRAAKKHGQKQVKALKTLGSSDKKITINKKLCLRKNYISSNYE